MVKFQEVISVIGFGWEALKITDKYFAEPCPKCGKNKWSKQKKLSKSLFTRKERMKCGSCGKTFNVS